MIIPVSLFCFIFSVTCLTAPVVRNAVNLLLSAFLTILDVTVFTHFWSCIPTITSKALCAFQWILRIYCFACMYKLTLALVLRSIKHKLFELITLIAVFMIHVRIPALWAAFNQAFLARHASNACLSVSFLALVTMRNLMLVKRELLAVFHNTFSVY